MTLTRLLPVLALTLLGACAQHADGMASPRVASAARGASDRADVSLSMTPTDRLVAVDGLSQVVVTKPSTTDDEVNAIDRERASHVTHEHHEMEHAPRMDHVRPHHGR